MVRNQGFWEGSWLEASGQGSRSQGSNGPESICQGLKIRVKVRGQMSSGHGSRVRMSRGKM